jgi:hypothetical protein
MDDLWWMNWLGMRHPYCIEKGGLRRVAIDFRGGIASLKDEMVEMRRDFHRRPERPSPMRRSRG